MSIFKKKCMIKSTHEFSRSIVVTLFTIKRQKFGDVFSSNSTVHHLSVKVHT